MSALDREIRAYYEAQALDDQRLDAILETARGQAAPAPSSAVWYARIAAVVAVLIGAFAFIHMELTSRDLTERVLAEIAMNHKKQLAVEVAAMDFSSLQEGLDRLEFSVVPPRRLIGDADLIGGRYCSIQGSLAAQMKLRDPETGVIRTLYATVIDPELESIGERTLSHDGVRISLWNEQGVFFGLAEDQTPPER